MQARLDYEITSVSASYIIRNAVIKPGIMSDHSLINITLDLIETKKRGKGFWKLNNSLLTDMDYIKIVKDSLKEIKNNYVTKNKNMKWEFVKCKICTKTIIYSKQKARKLKVK